MNEKNLLIGSENFFRSATREALIRNHFLIYSLSGQSLLDLRKAGHLIMGMSEDNPSFHITKSRQGEVALRRDQLLLAGSNNLPVNAQMELIARFSEELSKRLNGVEAIVGELPDYAELAFLHFQATGERLFGENFGHSHVITQVRPRNDVNIIGNFHAETGGLFIASKRYSTSHPNVWASPIIVPKALSR